VACCYVPAPTEGNPDDIWEFSLGSGYGRYVFDMAYQYRFGNDVGGSIMEEFSFPQDLGKHTVYASLIVHF